MTSSVSKQSISTENRPIPTDLPLFLPYVCMKLEAPFSVKVLLESQEEYISKTDEKNRRFIKTKPRIPSKISQTLEAEQENSFTLFSDTSGNDIVIIAVQDKNYHIVELRFNSCKEIPRLLLKIVALCVPYHAKLTMLTVRRPKLLLSEALYEICQFIPLSNITYVCLDHSPVPAKNYASLLDHRQLQQLTLTGCKLSDDDCIKIARALAHPLPASQSLQLLSLTSNMIGDLGTCALATVLRANRTLKYLNLSGNLITDVGSLAIFNIMLKFPLTYEEITDQRRLLIEYQKTQSKKKQSLPDLDLERSRSKDNPKKQPQHNVSSAKIVFYADSDPFGHEATIAKDGYVHSIGNTSLCYLNLAYNDLSHASVVALRDVLLYQQSLTKKQASGLLRVVLDGNWLPEYCEEYDLIQDLLDSVLCPKPSKAKKLKNKSKSMHLLKQPTIALSG